MPLTIKPLRSGADRVDNLAPAHLIDALKRRLNLKADADLCRALEISPPILSKLRNERIALSASLLLRMHDVTQIPISELRLLALKADA